MTETRDAAARPQRIDAFWNSMVGSMEVLGVTVEESPSVRTDREGALQRAMTECWISPGSGPPDVLRVMARTAAFLAESSPWRPVLADMVTLGVHTLTGYSDGDATTAEKLRPLGGSGDISNAAVLAMRDIVAITARDDPGLNVRLSALGIALKARFDWRGDVRDLHRAVAADRAAVRACPADHPFRRQFQGDLTVAWFRLANRTGDDRLLSAAVDAMREIAEDASEGDPLRMKALHKQAALLITRFERTGDSADLDQSIAILREALAACGRFTPAERAERVDEDLESILRSSLAHALTERHWHRKDAHSLDEAIEIARSEVTHDTLARAVPEELAVRWNLGRSLIALGCRDADTAALREALGIFTDLLTLDLTIVQRRKILDNTASTRVSLWRIGKGVTELNRAIDVYGKATKYYAPAEPDLVRHRNGLARALLDRFRTTSSRADLDAAVEQYRLAAEQENGPTLQRAKAAYAWGKALADVKDWSRALPGFSLAVELLPEVALAQLTPADRMKAFGDLYHLPSAAASCALNASQDTTAVQLLEHGRAVMAEQLLDVSDDIERLRALDPQLCGRYEQQRAARNTAGAQAAPDIASWKDTLRRIRKIIPGFHQPPKISDLFTRLHGRTVILVNVSDYRSDCLLVRDGTVTVVPLPDVTSDSALDEAQALYHGLSLALEADPEATAERGEQEVAESLGRIWDTIASPALRRAGTLRGGQADQEEPPRVWWIPCGPAALLPLHAAGRRDLESGRWNGASVPDRCISSYAPTLRSLARTAESHSQHSQRQVVAVASGSEGLPAIARELSTLAQYGVGEPLSGDGLMPRDVLAALLGAPVAHFACHGEWNSADPHESGFVLGPRPEQLLRVRELAALDLRGAELAYLSTCSTGLTATLALQLLDEGLTLSTAMHLAGFRNVIGTWCPVNDVVAARVVRKVYAAMRGPSPELDTDRSASALHQAVLSLRARYPDHPSVWAAYLHVGG